MNDNDTMKLRINISIERQFSGERLTVNNELEIPNQGFMELCSVLAQFDALAKKVKGEQKP